MTALRVIASRYEDVPGLGTEIRPCADAEAEWFQLEQQQPNGEWLVMEDFDTRAEAERRMEAAS